MRCYSNGFNEKMSVSCEQKKTRFLSRQNKGTERESRACSGIHLEHANVSVSRFPVQGLIRFPPTEHRAPSDVNKAACFTVSCYNKTTFYWIFYIVHRSDVISNWTGSMLTRRFACSKNSHIHDRDGLIRKGLSHLSENRPCDVGPQHYCTTSWPGSKCTKGRLEEKPARKPQCK